MFRRTVPLLLLAALVLPAAAAAENSELTGPMLVKGKGVMRAEVQVPDPARTRPLVLGGSAGVVRLTDLGGDLRVAGRCREVSTERGGEAVAGFVCRAAGGRLRVHGSHFRVAAALRTWALAIPRGASVTLRGRYRIAEPAGGSERQRQARERADREQRGAARD